MVLSRSFTCIISFSCSHLSYTGSPIPIFPKLKVLSGRENGNSSSTCAVWATMPSRPTLRLRYVHLSLALERVDRYIADTVLAILWIVVWVWLWCMCHLAERTLPGRLLAVVSVDVGFDLKSSFSNPPSCALYRVDQETKHVVSSFAHDVLPLMHKHNRV